MRRDGLSSVVRKMRNNRAPDFANRIEDHVVQINDAEPDSDELQTSFYGNSDPNFLTIENDSLFLHDKPRGTHHRADHKQFSVMDLRRVRPMVRLDIGLKRDGAPAAQLRRKKRSDAMSYPPQASSTNTEYKYQILILGTSPRTKRIREKSDKQLK
ncbi:hypothetical protein IB248_02390 [Rhizobium sp. RHZ01]|nr:hypothetical protein [Rhizobium sp. RHZ01]